MKLSTFKALPDGDIENFIVSETPGGIEAQERAGQVASVAADILPLECVGCTWGQLLEMGIQWLEKRDDLFANVVLPPGWRKVACEHSMWSDLLDDKGRKRASIFYKAAFYDRNAHISIVRRYSAGEWDSPEHDYQTTPVCGAVTDQDVVIWRTEGEVVRPGSGAERDEWDSYFKTRDNLAAEARSWLDEHYPDHKNPLAYWDDAEDA